MVRDLGLRARGGRLPASGALEVVGAEVIQRGVELHREFRSVIGLNFRDLDPEAHGLKEASPKLLAFPRVGHATEKPVAVLSYPGGVVAALGTLTVRTGQRRREARSGGTPYDHCAWTDEDSPVHAPHPPPASAA